MLNAKKKRKNLTNAIFSECTVDVNKHDGPYHLEYLVPGKGMT